LGIAHTRKITEKAGRPIGSLNLSRLGGCQTKVGKKGAEHADYRFSLDVKFFSQAEDRSPRCAADSEIVAGLRKVS
jgi:hypothetical protein